MDMAAIPWIEIAPFLLIGFCAQLIDGTLGMGFGLLSNGLLALIGVPPPLAAATVRTAESFVSGVSGISHALRRNVDWPLFARLVLPGVIGGVIGSRLILKLDIAIIRPVVFAYLAAVGVYLMWRAPRRPQGYRRLRLTAPAALFGAMIDATGGGWGPVVAGHLLSQGGNPRTVIGTVNAAEFFVTVTVTSVFIGTLGMQSFVLAAAGLLAGGLLAAPIGAMVVARADPRMVVLSVGVFLVLSSFWGIASLMLAPAGIFVGR